MLMKLSKKPRDRQIMYSRILNPLDKIQVLRKKILLKSMEKEGLNMRLKRDFVKEGTYGAQIRTKLIKVKLLPKMKRLIHQNINRTFCLGKNVTQTARFKASFMDQTHLLILMLLSSAFFKN